MLLLQLAGEGQPRCEKMWGRSEAKQCLFRETGVGRGCGGQLKGWVSEEAAAAGGGGAAAAAAASAASHTALEAQTPNPYYAF
jgi:hypothetical protein